MLELPFIAEPRVLLYGDLMVETERSRETKQPAVSSQPEIRLSDAPIQNLTPFVRVFLVPVK